MSGVPDSGQRPPPEEERPPYIPPELHSVAELAEDLDHDGQI